MDIKEIDQTYLANTYRRFPIELTSGRGSLVWDREGREYIDLGSGIAVNTLGYADPAWCAAVNAQLTTLQHSSNLYYTAPAALLARELCRRTGLKKVFFSNSGAEANECAIKVARKYAELHFPGQRDSILTLENSFHGRTLATLAATGQDGFHEDFLPLTPGFVYAEANLESVRQKLSEGRIAAILLEIVQGEGGVLALDPDFLQGLAELASEQDVLLLVDEVQTGIGRTGKLFAYMQHGLQPDVVSSAKGLAGGLPLGATLLGKKVQDVLTAGSHGSTFGGNPVAAAGALHVLERLDDSLLAEVEAKGRYLRSELENLPGIVSVSGMGLMLGLETTRPAVQVIDLCREQGLLVLQAKDKVRLLPSLNIPWPLLKEAVRRLSQALARADSQ